MSDYLALHVLNSLQNVGVEEVIVCPGARNAAFISRLAEASSPFRTVWHFEERSAAFFALGRIQASGKPVAVITTSGTAAGELLPAAMEAYYAGLPLILVTADRPRRFRGSGAPQAAEQSGIFGIYAPVALDLEGSERSLLPSRIDRPLHLNVCLEDPRGTTATTSPAPFESLEESLTQIHRPLIVVGRLAPLEREAVERFLTGLQAPVYLEALSGLRPSQKLEPFKIKIAEKIFQRGSFDGVLRIGSVPTHRLWRDLEDSFAHLPVTSISSLPFSGLGRPSAILPFEFPDPVIPRAADPEWFETDRRLYQGLAEILADEPRSEPGLFRLLSQRVEVGANVFLGNSLPIREWDLAADWERPLEASASRGLNGIDGQLSTFLGLCLPDRPNWAVLGDLTTLYDLAGPWPLAQMDPKISATLVTVNNSGGRIFERMFPTPAFVNSHDRGFRHWAEMWDLPYQISDRPAEIQTGPGLRIVELRPEAASTARFWERFGALLA